MRAVPRCLGEVDKSEFGEFCDLCHDPGGTRKRETIVAVRAWVLDVAEALTLIIVKNNGFAIIRDPIVKGLSDHFAVGVVSVCREDQDSTWTKARLKDTEELEPEVSIEVGEQ